MVGRSFNVFFFSPTTRKAVSSSGFRISVRFLLHIVFRTVHSFVFLWLVFRAEQFITHEFVISKEI